MDTLEDERKNFKVNSLIHSEPVKVMIVLCHMGTRVKIEHSAEGKVLDSLEFGEVG